MQRLRESNRQVADDLHAQQSNGTNYQSQSVYQPPSYQPPSYESRYDYQPTLPSYQNPLDSHRIGTGGLIYGTFLWILIGGAIWLFVTVLPFLLAVLGFLFSAALVIGAIVGGIWLLVTIINAFSSGGN